MWSSLPCGVIQSPKKSHCVVKFQGQSNPSEVLVCTSAKERSLRTVGQGPRGCLMSPCVLYTPRHCNNDARPRWVTPTRHCGCCERHITVCPCTSAKSRCHFVKHAPTPKFASEIQRRCDISTVATTLLMLTIHSLISPTVIPR